MAAKINFAAVSVLVMLAAAAVGKTDAATYEVGDSVGWTIPSSASVYTNWASQHTFYVGDILVFNFSTGAHDVAIVPKASYDGCTSSNPISLKTVGPANINLAAPGQAYFICTFGQHCSLGQKLTVDVKAAASSTPSSPPTAAPAPKSTPPPATTPVSTPPPASTPSITPAPPTSVPAPATTPTAPSPAPTTTTTTPGGVPAPSPSSVLPSSPAPGPGGAAPSTAPSPGGSGESAPGSSPSPIGKAPGSSPPPSESVSPPPPPSSAPATATATATTVILVSFVIGIMC